MSMPASAQKELSADVVPVQSKRGAALIYKYPILLDACANEMQRKGDAMMSKWAEVTSALKQG